MKFAVLIAGRGRDYLYYLYRGFRQYIMEEPEAELHIYLCFGKKDRQKAYEQAEYDFYQLPDLSEYDGIILAAQTIMDSRVRRELIERIRESGRPCVSVEEPVEGMSCVGIDQYQAVQEIMRHMVDVHHARFFGYVGGIGGTYEAKVREQAFRDMIQQGGLRTAPEWIFQMEYEYDDGLEVGRRLLEAHLQGREVPDTMICASDDMAAGLCDAIYDTGLWRMVRVSGFDRYMTGERFTPTLTTVARPREQVSYECCHLLQRMAEGHLPVQRKLKYQTIYGGSCGCQMRQNFREKDKYQRLGFHREQKQQAMLSRIDKMEERITGDMLGQEIREEIRSVFGALGFKRVRTFLRPDMFSEQACCYCDCVKQSFDWTYPENPGRGRSPMVYIPLHFQHRIMGYCAVEGADLLIEYGLLETLVRKICFSMENYIQKKQYYRINQKYQRLYMTDQLTGLYNRFGLQEYGQRLYRRNCEQHRDTQIIFCDINRLKYINDTFGHKAGDWAICMVGKALRQQEEDNCLPFRYGGDEFILIAEAVEGRDIIARIQDALEKCQEQEPQEFHLDISIGSITALWREPQKDLERYFTLADEAMYQEKLRYYGVGGN